MKIQRLVTGVLAVYGMVMSGAALASNEPDLVTAPVEKVFIPQGFDNNDNVEVVVHGHFPNSCYRVGPITAKFDEERNQIEVDAQAYFYKNQPICMQVLMSFTQSVKVGLVKSGSHKVVVKNRPMAITPRLDILEALTPDADDYLYAPVAQVLVSAQQGAGETLTIEGTYPYTFTGCMVVTDVRTRLSSNDVLVVQPIAKFTEGEECEGQAQNRKFSIKKDMTSILPSEDYLIHVRTLNGNSLNSFIEQ